MILFALTLTNDIGSADRALQRFSSFNWTAWSTATLQGTTVGLRTSISDSRGETYFLEPTNVVSPERYLVTTIDIQSTSPTSAAVPEFRLFGMPFVGNKDMQGTSIIDVGTLNVCVVHDTETGEGFGYINGRYLGTFEATRRIEILPNTPIATLRLTLSNLAIHSVANPTPMKPFIPELVPLGNDQTGWTVPTDLEADLSKNDPYLLEPSVSTRLDGSQIRVPAVGRTLIEAAGMIETTAESHIEVQGQTLVLGNTQGPAKALLIDSVDAVTITRVPD